MVFKNIKKTAFSLIELLIALIIISIITSALVPVISKKLITMSATINGVINGGNTNNGGSNSNMPPELNSQEVCDKIAPNLLFLSARENGGKAACVTKANVGDTYVDGPEIASSAGVNVVNAGESCNKSKCCWLGNNVGETSYYCNESGNGDSTYSGCKRTVCTWAAAESACENWEPINGTKGKWRLPTRNELSAWSSNISTIQLNQGKKGLELCDTNSGNGSVYCSNNISPACEGSYENACSPSNIWTIEESSQYAYYGYIRTGEFKIGSYYQTEAFSARCLIDEDAYKEAVKNNTSDNGDNSGGNNGGNTSETPDTSLITSQADCDKLGNNLLFLTAAQNGGKRACVTRANAGDISVNGPEITDDMGITKVAGGKSCGSAANYTAKCCWIGDGTNYTADNNACNAENGDSGYSGCKRSVCNLAAAKTICENWGSNDSTKGKWRLPTKKEALAWGKNLANIQTNKGTSGLELCSYDPGSGSSQCLYASYCKGAYNDSCAPYTIWVDGDGSTSRSFAPYLHTARFLSNYYPKSSAFSVRCIIDEDDIKGTRSGEETSNLPSDITSQSDCDKIGKGLIFLSAAYNGGTAACVTKANVGDSYADGPDLDEIKDKAEITVVEAGAECGESNAYTKAKCCWLANNKGTTSTGCTSNGNGDSTYSGCKRTVCNWNAGKAACENWEPSGSNTKGKWRMPTTDELYAWGKNLNSIQLNKGKSGLQLCDDYSGYGSASCDYSNACKNSYCYPYNVWSLTKYTESDSYLFNLSKGAPDYKNTGDELRSMEKHSAYSIRCVLDAKTYKGGSLDTKITSQQDCDKLGNGLLYIPYSLNGGKSICITKANLGDTNYDGPNLYGVNVVSSGSSCSGNCCWTGTTSTNCDSGYFNTSSTYTWYSGCTRTVCTWDASKTVCNAFYPTYGSATRGKWRLPTLNEVSSWEDNLDVFQTKRGRSGLDLCSMNQKDGSVYCDIGRSCTGSSYYDNCTPYSLWVKEERTSSTVPYKYFGGDYFSTDSSDKSSAKTARCVLDEDTYK